MRLRSAAAVFVAGGVIILAIGVAAADECVAPGGAGGCFETIQGAIDADGKILASLQDPSARYPKTTGVCETDDYLFVTRLFGSDMPYIANQLGNE